jgi:hypothetical protein
MHSGASCSSDEDGAGAAPGDLLEELFRSGGGAAHAAVAARRGSVASSGSKASLARGAGPAGGAGGHPAPAEQQRQEDLARLKAERKRFMSPKAAVVGGSGSSQQPSQRRKPGGGAAAAADEDGGLSRAEFLEMQREVQLYGGCPSLGSKDQFPLLAVHCSEPHAPCSPGRCGACVRGSSGRAGQPREAPPAPPLLLPNRSRKSFPCGTRAARRTVPPSQPPCGHIVQTIAVARPPGLGQLPCAAASNSRHMPPFQTCSYGPLGAAHCALMLPLSSCRACVCR